MKQLEKQKNKHNWPFHSRGNFLWAKSASHKVRLVGVLWGMVHVVLKGIFVVVYCDIPFIEYIL